MPRPHQNKPLFAPLLLAGALPIFIQQEKWKRAETEDFHGDKIKDLADFQKRCQRFAK